MSAVKTRQYYSKKKTKKENTDLIDNDQANSSECD